MSSSTRNVFIKYIPINTTKDELAKFFSVCGAVVNVSLNLSHINRTDSSTYVYGFVAYETQTEADCAVQEMHGRLMENSKGRSKKLSVVHAWPQERKEKNEISNEQEKETEAYWELWQTWKANEEKIKQIYNKKAEEQEINKLREKLSQLEAKHKELTKTNNAIIQGNSILCLQVKIKNLEVENTKLKEGK